MGAAVVVLVSAAAFGALSLGLGDTVPAVPVTAPRSTVVVDAFSGRENPRVDLEASVSLQLYAMLADQKSAGLLRRASLPDQDLGFRALVVTPADAALPVLRILPTAVYVSDAGTYLKLDDPDGLFYIRVRDAIRPLLADDVRGVLPS
jgi:hypothetical protein